MSYSRACCALYRNSLHWLSRVGAAVALAFASASVGSAVEVDGKGVPLNLGGGLRELVAWHHAQAANLPGEKRASALREHLKQTGNRAQSDAAGRLVVDVRLDGTLGLEAVRQSITQLGAEVFASVAPGQSLAAAHGLLSARLPLGSAMAASQLPGVQSIVLVRPPRRHVGKRTSQGVAAMRVTPVLRKKITGAGITVGVVSDSFNFTTPSASEDARKDDLPGPGNRAGRVIPVNVLTDELDPANDPSDEGRAMLQIIHDVAPDAKLAFCTCGQTQATFADAIRRLRTEALCDVIVDDIGFSEEPIFSDGIVTQAVEDVVNSTTLAGPKALYYSAAGNAGTLGYEADFSLVSANDVQQGNVTSVIRTNQVPDALKAGGFHNFTPGSTPTIAQKLTIINNSAEINLQWNDLFDATKMTSDFNLLVFDEQGNYLDSFSGTDDAFSTGVAADIINLDPNDDGTDRTYYVAITRRSGGTGEAKHFRYFLDTNGDASGEFLSDAIPTMLGHSASRSGDGVAAYAFNRLKFPEDFTSWGSIAIYFNDKGDRLTQPEVRNQPTIAAPDGVATTLPDFNPFFGTSAAAPHAAAVAALLLDAAGGPGSLSATDVRQILQDTARLHDLDPYSASAKSTSATGTVTLTGSGGTSAFSSSNPNFFTLSFTGPSGAQLQSVLIDLGPAGLKFDERTDLGQPFVVGSVGGGVSGKINHSLLSGARKLRIDFDSFPAGGQITFGIDRDLARLKRAGNTGDELVRATVTASILPVGGSRPVSQRAAFRNEIGTGFSKLDGFGFIDANAALKVLAP